MKKNDRLKVWIKNKNHLTKIKTDENKELKFELDLKLTEEEENMTVIGRKRHSETHISLAVAWNESSHREASKCNHS